MSGGTGPSRPSLLILAFSPIAQDARVRKQVALFAPDYDVTTVGYGPAPDGVVAHHEIPADLIAWHKDRLGLIVRRYSSVYWGNAVVAHLRAVLPVHAFDAILADDADTVPLALWLRPRAGVHADLHEYAPRENEESRRWRTFVAPYYRWICRTFLPRCASLTTVGAGLAEEYRREFGLEVGVVPNATPFLDTEPTKVHEPIRLVHSGNARRNRNLGLMIDAVVNTSVSVTLDLYLMPNDPAYLAELREQAARTERVRIHDPVPYERLVRTLTDYDVGVFVLPPITFNYLWTLPNKLFDFIQGRLGVIIGPSPEMAALVRRHGVGEVTSDFTAQALTETLDALDAARVRRWKLASHAVARDLSADVGMTGWSGPVSALLERG
ncbi:glycosyltransferase family 1 protein [Occultella kanbiaonis]|uniref:glycosyltransferase family 1 protein n=1 Tax=Occultella kanbiaonis TaxID=2675754 RepID=UPI0012B6E258|nr:glycosyltransferase family 1 protein [Occultella kanbiaonis]